MISIKSEHFHQPSEIIRAIENAEVILLMSKNAVDGMKDWLCCYDQKIDCFDILPFWTVGGRTGQYLKRELGISSWHPNKMTGEGVLQALSDSKYTSIILIAAKQPRSELLNGLKEFGVTYFHFPVYNTCIIENTNFYQQFHNSRKSSIIVFTSPSTVQGTLNSLSISNFTELDCKLVSIGPTTSGEIEYWGGEIFYESKNQDINTLYTEIASLELTDE